MHEKTEVSADAVCSASLEGASERPVSLAYVRSSQCLASRVPTASDGGSLLEVVDDRKGTMTAVLGFLTCASERRSVDTG